MTVVLGGIVTLSGNIAAVWYGAESKVELAGGRQWRRQRSWLSRGNELQN